MLGTHALFVIGTCEAYWLAFDQGLCVSIVASAHNVEKDVGPSLVLWRPFHASQLAIRGTVAQASKHAGEGGRRGFRGKACGSDAREEGLKTAPA